MRHSLHERREEALAEYRAQYVAGLMHGSVTPGDALLHSARRTAPALAWHDLGSTGRGESPATLPPPLSRSPLRPSPPALQPAAGAPANPAGATDTRQLVAVLHDVVERKKRELRVREREIRMGVEELKRTLAKSPGVVGAVADGAGVGGVADRGGVTGHVGTPPDREELESTSRAYNEDVRMLRELRACLKALQESAGGAAGEAGAGATAGVGAGAEYGRGSPDRGEPSYARGGAEWAAPAWSVRDGGAAGAAGLRGSVPAQRDARVGGSSQGKDLASLFRELSHRFHRELEGHAGWASGAANDLETHLASRRGR